MPGKEVEGFEGWGSVDNVAEKWVDKWGKEKSADSGVERGGGGGKKGLCSRGWKFDHGGGDGRGRVKGGMRIRVLEGYYEVWAKWLAWRWVITRRNLQMDRHTSDKLVVIKRGTSCPSG